MTVDRQFISSLDRGLRVLQAISRSSRGSTNGEIAVETGLAPSTVSRLLHTLRNIGYISLDPDTRRYILTPRVLTLGYSLLSETGLLPRVRPILQQVAEATRETVGLAVRDGSNATFLDCARGRNVLAVQIEVGARLPLATSAAGLALLKGLDEADRKLTAARLRADLTRQRKSGKAFDRLLRAALDAPVVVVRDTWHNGVGGVAVPVRFGREKGAITVAVSTAIVDEETMRAQIGKTLIDAVRRHQLAPLD